MSDNYDGSKFFTRENGVLTATPLLLVLAVIELSDVLFAVDSIPAVRHVHTCLRAAGSVHLVHHSACARMRGGTSSVSARAGLGMGLSLEPKQPCAS